MSRLKIFQMERYLITNRVIREVKILRIITKEMSRHRLEHLRLDPETTEVLFKV
jgi:hypothetical protein